MAEKQKEAVSETQKKDARTAIWALAIINGFALIFYLADGGMHEFTLAALIAQGFILVFWLLPVFFYQKAVQKLPYKAAVLRALASYRRAMDNVSW
ncbi:hypothetical protein [Biformimicrobium ophioploci]|uniref:Uncharacterized protein n=1 Tax=Biformimicrobium ophioploci TaxID=3036711 RepID=A0ABQ6M327_9GAMM|nr:hypothetical protein [Microbulbifer sp. NKW57]GMG88753.1 hypothetical protein MNKW57_30740 [Microbulbifer sp. NKW57]